MKKWSIEQSRELYNITHWGKPYFNINTKGNICVKPRQNSLAEIDLSEVAQAIKDQNLNWPVLLRITDILPDRVNTLQNAFDKAMSNLAYQAKYTPVYPIKVNQQRTVVEHLTHNNDNIGLEAGSKSELMVVLSHTSTQSVIICNGYKDETYIRLALIGQKIGHRIFIVIEKPSELTLVLNEAKKLNIIPLLGIRIRLASIGKGNWQNTGGEKSKFGLSANQILSLVNELKQNNALSYLQLIHCHLGSQLANIRDIQKGLKEVAQYYAELRKLEVPVQVIDVGGGLGVDYDGSRSRNFCSMNYSIQEYANDIVHAFWQICSEQQLPNPDIITESGRAMTAHHAILIANVIDTETIAESSTITAATSDDPMIIQNLWETLINIDKRSLQESYHDAIHWMAEAQVIYTHGILNLASRAKAEQIYLQICQQIRPLLSPGSSAERIIIDELNDKLADKYFCNLSIFQSIPDAWAIDQVFPIVPLQRLNERPDRRVTIQDLTCDSDGAINYYVNNDGSNTTLPAHSIKHGENYLIGVFLTGAYQEILGDMHNLFGDTHAINLALSDDVSTKNNFKLSELEKGDTIKEILNYVHFNIEQIVTNYQQKIQNAHLSEEDQHLFLNELKAGLDSYSYLENSE